MDARTSRIETYLQNADECERLAKAAGDLSARSELQYAAESWRRLARQWVRLEPIDLPQAS